MCGRITQKSDPKILGLKVTNLIEPLYASNTPPRYNGAPGQEHWLIRENPKSHERTMERLWWGLIPSWVKDEKGGRKPINARAETITTLPTFKDAYRKRRAILPIDSFFEWKAVEGSKTKQPFAIGLSSGEPFGVAAIWENWKRPGTDEWMRTFAVVTCAPNELMETIHDRMPVILPADGYDRWLGDEANPDELLSPYPAAAMHAWPITTRVNSPKNDDPEILEAV